MCKTSMPSHHIPISKKNNFEAYVSQHSDGISKMVFGEVPLGVSSYVCSFFPIPNSWGDAGVPDNQTQKRRRFICVKGNSTTCYRLTLSLLRESL